MEKKNFALINDQRFDFCFKYKIILKLMIIVYPFNKLIKNEN